METKTPCYNEVFEGGDTAREPYGPLLETRELLGPGMLAERYARASEKLRKLGATFPLPDDPEGKNRVLPADWIPRIILRGHWGKLSAELLQKALGEHVYTRLLNVKREEFEEHRLQVTPYQIEKFLPIL
ncbi:MAG TPA: hypothetical protein VHF46_01490 [Rubrobacteraceae bacterium]|nr:hypothetical protein [Rubrobacteraceae bacterium]